jgi:hypothetical protein
VHIVVNGELYDSERIQRELEGRGHRLLLLSACALQDRYGLSS